MNQGLARYKELKNAVALEFANDLVVLEEAFELF